MIRRAIPGFELVRPVGGGRLTHVFAAVRQSDGCPCALKLPAPGWADHADAIRLLRQEARALAAVHHHHVVRLLDAHLAEDPIHLVLQWTPGQSLRDWLRRDFRLDLPAASWIARQLAEAIQAIHQAGFIHGDVKPENIVLSADGVVTVIDLGFAHRPGEIGDAAGAGILLGSTDYVAPEHAQTPRVDGFESDWFSLGVVLHEMLTGALPHGSRSMADLAHGRVSGSLVDANAARLWPPRLTALIASLLASSPAERPAGPLIVHELLALEIASLGQRRAA